MKIVKKVIPGFIDEVISGKKKFDFRLNDFEINEGDTLVLEEYDSLDPDIRKPTGRVVEKKVSYVLKTKLQDLWWSEKDILEKGIQIISFE